MILTSLTDLSENRVRIKHPLALGGLHRGKKTKRKDGDRSQVAPSKKEALWHWGGLSVLWKMNDIVVKRRLCSTKIKYFSKFVA